MYIHIAKDLRNKLGVKAIKSVLLGYDSLTKGYHCFEPISNKIIISHDVRFNEQQLGDFKQVDSPIIDHDFFANLFPSILSDEAGSTPSGHLGEPPTHLEITPEHHSDSPSSEPHSHSPSSEHSSSPILLVVSSPLVSHNEALPFFSLKIYSDARRTSQVRQGSSRLSYHKCSIPA